MITDGRSQKVKHVTRNSAAELVWWFSKTSEQYRVAGDIIFVGSPPRTPAEAEGTGTTAASVVGVSTASAAGVSLHLTPETQLKLQQHRKQQWGNLRDSGREQFYWQQPGIDFGGKPVVPAGGRGEDGKVLSPPDNFLLMLLVPNKIKYLRLTDNFAQEGTRQDGTSAWTNLRVNP